MKIMIEDNGCGMTKEQQEKINGVLSGDASMHMEGTGIGIENVAARLRIYYGSKLSISMCSKEGEGTCFTILLPLPDNLSGEEEEMTNEGRLFP